MTAKEYLHSIKIKDAIINNLQHDKEDLRDMLYSLGGTEAVIACKIAVTMTNSARCMHE